MKNLLERLSTIESTLPTKQKKLCEYITANGKSVYLMSVGSLSEAAGVGRATVIRLVESLGYPSYAEFKKALNASYFEAAENHYHSNPFFWADEQGALLPEDTDSINACGFYSRRPRNSTVRSLARSSTF